MSTLQQTKFFKLATLPQVLEANAFYYILNGDYAETYITDNTATAKMIGNTSMINTLIDKKLSDYSAIEIVETIDNRDELSLFHGLMVLVQDATADTTVISGSALYVYNEDISKYIKLTEYESLDLSLTWDSILNKPSSSVESIDDTVNKMKSISSSADDIDTAVIKSKALKDASDINDAVDKIVAVKASSTDLDNAVDKSHEHANEEILSLIGKDSENNLTFNNVVINTWDDIDW